MFRGSDFHSLFFDYPHFLLCFLVLKMNVFFLLKDKKISVDLKKRSENQFSIH